jgi:hypothetical protein
LKVEPTKKHQPSKRALPFFTTHNQYSGFFKNFPILYGPKSLDIFPCRLSQFTFEPSPTLTPKVAFFSTILCHLQPVAFA